MIYDFLKVILKLIDVDFLKWIKGKDIKHNAQLIILYSIIVIITLQTIITNKTKSDMDFIKNSARVRLIRGRLELLRDDICTYSHLKKKVCPISVRSFTFHFNTKLKKYDSGIWCMGQSDVFNSPNYFEQKEIPADSICKNFLLNLKTPELLHKKYVATYCPFLVDGCLFTADNRGGEKNYSVLFCNKDTNYNGVSCFAIIDGGSIANYKLTSAPLPINEMFSKRLQNIDLSYFGS